MIENVRISSAPRPRVSFQHLGFKNHRWPHQTVRGNESTFAQLYLRPRDMLKFGILYLARRPTCHICSEFV